MDAIKRADEVAAMGPVTSKMSPAVDKDAAISMLVRGYNALLAGFLAAQAILEALGVNPAMAAYAIEQGWTPMTHLSEGFEETSIGRWSSEFVGRRQLEFTERPCYHKWDEGYEYDDTPPDADDEDADPWGQFFVVDSTDYGTCVGYPWDQRDAVIKHWKDGADGH